MKNKFNLTREQNVFVAKRNIVDYIWKSANLEGIGVTYPETQVIYDNGIVNGLTVDNIIAINNLKYAWEFILENDNIDYDFNSLCQIHKLTCDKLVLDGNLGRLIINPVKEELVKLFNQPLKTKTEIAIEVMLWIMRRQMFIDGNKRVAMLFANKIMIDNGCGIITIANDIQSEFYEKLIKFYETGDMSVLKKFIYDNAIDGLVFENKEEIK